MKAQVSRFPLAIVAGIAVCTWVYVPNVRALIKTLIWVVTGVILLSSAAVAGDRGAVVRARTGEVIYFIMAAVGAYKLNRAIHKKKEDGEDDEK